VHASHRVVTFVLMFAVVLSNVGLPVIAEPTLPNGSTNASADAASTAPPQNISSPSQTASQSLLAQTQPIGAQQPAAPTVFNNSLTIDLSGYVSVTHSSAIQPTVAATYEVWIRRSTTTSGCQAILGKDYTQAYWLGLCNNVIRFHSGGTASAQDGTTAIPAGVWTHIAVTWDTVSNTRKYYINGDLEYTGTAGAAPTGTRELRIGYDGVNTGDEFAGNIAEVRIWNIARSQDDIRHTLNEAIQAPLPGLVADWHLSDDYTDSIGGHNGVPIGPISLGGPASPAQPIYVTIDKDFNTLPYGRYGAATVYLPNTNQALLIGGILNGAITNRIDAVDAATGVAKPLGTLPSNRDFLSAAYDPDRNTVYVFGGSDTFNGSTFANTIYAIDFPTGTVRTLAATLLAPAYGIGAVYDSQQKRIYLLGGYSGSVLNSINVFDPQSETIGTTSVTLPQPDYQMAAIYSPLSDRIYTFGGLTTGGTAVNTIDSLNFTSATTGSVTQLSAHLPQADFTQNPVLDAHTGLIYLIGGLNTDQVLAFDPVTNNLWTTLIKLPQTRSYAGAVYSARNRQALFIGGGAYLSNGDSEVYRIPLGDGPSVPIGRWDFPASTITHTINSIAGEKNVYVGTNGEGLWRYYPNGTSFQIPGGDYGSASGIVNGMYYDPNADKLWFGTSDAYGWTYDGSAMVGYNSGNTNASMVNPVYSTDGFFWGHGNGAVWQSSNNAWNNSLSSNVTSLASRTGDPAPLLNFVEWAAVGSPIIPRPSGPITNSVNSPNNNYNFNYSLHRLTFNLLLGGTGTDVDYGTPCGYATINDLRFDRNGDFFIPNGVGTCFIANNPNYGSSLSGSEIFPVNGGQTAQASMDKDGRIWIASQGYSSPNNSGGLYAYEVAGNYPTPTVTSSEYNWLNAPVGSRLYGSGTWLSNIDAVGAAGERVWAGRTDGQLVTLAQRWQQIDQSDSIGNQAIENIWMARGRAFLAQNSAVGGNLYVLMPDGKTWDNRSGVHVRSVLGDSQGRIWVGTDNDVRLYTSTGWITFTASLAQGTPPIGPVYSIAQDQQGRIWIGSANGLTLFDRNRFVFTLNKTNFGLPDNAVRTLTIDRDNAVWAGTTNGLAKVDAGGALITYTVASGLPSNSIYSLAQTGDGTLAVSTDNGFAVLTGTTFITESLPIPATNLPLTLDNLGHLWAGSAVRTGSNQWFAYYNNNSGLRSSTVSGVAADGADKVWFSHSPDTGVSVRSAFLPPLSDSVPIISSITPDHGSAGDFITINGTGFGSNVGVVQVTIGGVNVDVFTVTPSSILVRLNRDNISGDVDVRVGKRHTTLAGSSQPAFCAVPYIISFSPTGGDYGVVVDVTGGNIDPGYKLNVGSGPTRQYAYDTPRHFRFPIVSGDVTGNLKLTNICLGISTTDSREFRVIGLGVDRLVLNQGLPSYELVTQRPTLLEHFLTRSVDARQSDQIALDSIDLQITDLATNNTTYKTIPYSGTVPTTLGAPSFAQLLDTVNSINVPNIFLNTDAAGGTVQIKSIFKNRGYVVTQNTTTAKLSGNEPIRVLFVPIMHSGYNYADLTTMEANVNKDLNALTYRLMPQGRVQWYWSDEIRVSGSVDIGNVLNLYEAGHDMDRIRKDWNKTHSQSQVVVAFGIVDGQIASGGKDGLAFWPDLSSILNHTALAPFEALCGLANTAAKILTFGLAGDVCNADIPLYVGWARGDRADSSALIGHELGHISELVKPEAINGSWTDNFSHSVNDEISNGECQSSGSAFDWSKSLYTQPGVSDPVVDPITGKQYYPQNDGNVFTPRGKAIMSYACAKNSSNVFFEPADYTKLRAGVDIYFQQNSSKLAQSLAVLNPSTPLTTTIPGPRLYVSGAITQSNNTASFTTIERPTDEPPLSLDFTTGYDLVQRASNGAELSRLGVYPLFTSTDDQGLEATATTTTTNDVGFFSATVLRATGVVTIELQHNGVVLAKFHAGNAVPSINLTSPTAGTYNTNVPVTWSASDADGDPLNISIEYSRDGSNWTPVGQGAGNSGTINVPTFQLGGSHTAQVRAFASDGFNVGVYTSTQFTVPNQPPLPSITSPQSGATFLEGQSIDLTGSALDKQDGVITDTQLIWRSSRDGQLGGGSDLPVILSVGVHTITLQATNSVGLSATTSITLSVVGDYVMDGIPDSQKLSGNMNPLDDKLAYSDADHDGLPLIMELKWGTNPNKADSDNDGYSDAAEIAAGTDPNSAASNPGNQPPDRLVVGPAVITFTADLADAVPFPQQAVVIASHNLVSWTLSTAAPWLSTSTTNGQTPNGVTIEALPYNLGNGQYTGVINFSSPQLTNTVAVTVNLTVINAAGNCDVNRDGLSNETDVQLVQSAIGTDYTQPNFNLRYDLNRDGTITAADVTLTQACVARQSAYRLYLPLIRK
jgi:hypothetical protein